MHLLGGRTCLPLNRNATFKENPAAIYLLHKHHTLSEFGTRASIKPASKRSFVPTPLALALELAELVNRQCPPHPTSLRLSKRIAAYLVKWMGPTTKYIPF